MDPLQDIPDPIRRRLAARRRRFKIIRFTFAATAVLAVMLMYGASIYQGVVLTWTQVQLAPAESGDALWLLHQTETRGTKRGDRTGTFRLHRVRDSEIEKGPEFEGLTNGFVELGSGRIGIVFDTRLTIHDSTTPGWPQLEVRKLGLDVLRGSPTVAVLESRPWLCWVSQSYIMVRPLDSPRAKPVRVQKTGGAETVLQAVSAGGRLWLSVHSRASNRLKLVSFVPYLEPPDAEGPGDGEDDSSANDAERPAKAANEPGASEPPQPAAPPPPRPAVKEIAHSDVRGDVLRASLAVLVGRGQPTAVFALSLKGDGADEWEVWVKPGAGNWKSASVAPGAARKGGLDFRSFMALGAHGEQLVAVYSGGGKIWRCDARWTDAAQLDWSEPTELEIDQPAGAGTLMIWMSLLLILVIAMAGQGVWLLLNREREIDRSLAKLVRMREDAAESEGKGSRTADGAKAKEEPRLIYANTLARAGALMLDLIMTCPVVLLLKSVYQFELEQAYGFLLLGTAGSEHSDPLAILQASLITLVILAIYATVCEMFWGRTFGKALLHLRVVDRENDQPAGWRIVLRNLIRVVELAHWTVLLVPMLLMMLTGKQQRLGDLAAGTFVVVEAVSDEQPDDAEL